MTIAEVIEELKTYPEDQSLFIRVWLKDNRDYLDYGHIDVVLDKLQQSVSGGAMLTGTDQRQ